MYTLLKTLYDEWTKLPTINIAIIGEYNSGKSTLTNQIRANCDLEYVPLKPWQIKPTLGCNATRFRWNEKRIELCLWDMGGRPDIRSLWKPYIDDCDGLIFVLDVVAFSEDSLNETINNLTKSNLDLNRIPILIVCNKIDSQLDCGILDKIKRHLHFLMQDSSILNVMIMPCSALGNQLVREGFEWIVDIITCSK